LLPLPPLNERRYCDARRHAVCVSTVLVSAVKVMRYIQCCLVWIYVVSSRRVRVRVCVSIWQDGQAPRFSHLAAMYTELVAVNLAGQLCQWRWCDPEPFTANDVRNFENDYSHTCCDISIYSLHVRSWLPVSVSNFLSRHRCFFIALTLLVEWQEGHLAYKNFAPKHLSHGSWY